MKTIVAKFGGTSLADAEQFRKVRGILELEPTRRYLVPSAPGKRFSGDDKVTDLLYLCHAQAAEGKPFDETFAKIIAIIRIAVPYTGMIISTREGKSVREKALRLGISQISGGSRTSVGGYVEPEDEDENSAQFDVSDQRTLDEVVKWLMDLGYIPSFCTACYREGRTGDRFMSLCKSGQIQNCCHPNALMTLEEYLMDYASPATREVGEKMIERELLNIPKEKVRKIATEYIEEIKKDGKRDFRF